MSAAAATWRRHAAWLCALPVFGVYVALAAPGIEWLDAGELTAAAWSLGISHPPGQPLHALLGRALAFLPFGEIAFRVTLVSALAAALVVPGIVAAARALVPRRDDDDGAGYDDAATLVLALLTALSPLVIEQATRQEVYAPALALIVWGLAFALRDQARPAVFLLGLAATLQPLMAAAVVVPAGIALITAAPRRAPRLALSLLPVALLALAPILYLPLRALARHPALLVWGDPSTTSRLVDVVTGRAYGQNFASAGLGARVVGHALLLGEGLGLGLLAAGLAGVGFGLMTRLRRAWVLALALVLALVLAAGQKIFHPENPDIHGYLTPALAVLAIGAAVLPAAGARLGQKLALPAWTGLVVLAPFVGLAGVGAAGGTTFVEDGGARSGDAPLLLWDATIGRVAPGPGAYLADSDHAIFPALYERLCAGARPDVAIAPRPLFTSSWALRMIDTQLPALAVPFVDDGGRTDHLLERFVFDNGRAGRVLAAEQPAALGPLASPMGRAFTVGAPASPPAPPPIYPGGFGARVARHVALTRAAWELARGDRAAATAALGLRADPADTTPTTRRPVAALLPVLPGRELFVSAPWQTDAVARDLVFLRGAAPEATATDAPELRLLGAWHTILAAPPPAPSAALDVARALGPLAVRATARVLADAGRADEAAATLRSADR